MGGIIDGKALAAVVKDEVRQQVEELEYKVGRKPCLVVIVVGDNPDSQLYVRNKVRVAASLGMDSRLIEFHDSVTEEALLGQIFSLNNDSIVDGILVQLPLPEHIDEEKIIDAIDCDKDVDGFHPMNVAGLWLNKDCIIPCTPAGIIRLIDSIGYDLVGKNAVVVGRSNIVGKPIAKLLLDRHATVTIAHSRTANLEAVCLTADVLITAVGKAGLIDANMIKPGAVVIDVGMNHTKEGKLCGDVDFVSVQPISSWITPVPGGVGPMTIAMLMKNTLLCYMKHNSN
jgi:methylenetetrahydrofolate dehydrogenase (NADP+)/methenyltetrahydrofolate cyclohydrolase